MIKKLQNRITWIDYAKGIGIVLVVYGHVLVGLKGASLGFSEQFHFFSHNIVYSFHMPLFFFIAGLNVCRSLSKKGSVSFVLNKIPVIIYPYIVWSLLTGSIQVFLSNYTNSTITIYDLMHIWYCPLPDQHYWFLYTLFLMYAVYAVFPILFKSFSFSGYAFFFLSLILFFSNINTPIRVLDKFIYNVIFFAIGVLCSKNFFIVNKLINKNISFIIVSIILLTFIGSELSYLSIYESFDSKTVRLLFANAGIVTVILLSGYLASKGSLGVIKKIGRYSMVIYLAHGLCGSGVRIILSKVFRVENSIAHTVIGVFCGVFLPIFMYELSIKIKAPFLFKAPKFFFTKKTKPMTISDN